MTELVGNYPVLVAGAGAVFEEKVAHALDVLGPAEKRVIFDLNYQRAASVRGAAPVLADALNPPFFAPNRVAFIATPDHLPAIKSLVTSAGVRKFIVEKPLVINTKEIQSLQEIMNAHPDLKIYPLDFYIQKAAPLLILTGKIKPDDPRWQWVVSDKGEPANAELSGKLPELIGKLEGIEVTIHEGGNFGLPDLEKRRWLELDKVKGGMLLDLGTHALTPLIVSGILNIGSTQIISLQRFILGPNRSTYEQIDNADVSPEIFANARLNVQHDGKRIPFFLSVGKTFDEGGLWHVILRGNQGQVSMGTRTGDALVYNPKRGSPFQLKLRSGSDPYSLAFQEALLYFQDYPNFDGNFAAMVDAVKLIDQMRPTFKFTYTNGIDLYGLLQKLSAFDQERFDNEELIHVLVGDYQGADDSDLGDERIEQWRRKCDLQLKEFEIVMETMRYVMYPWRGKPQITIGDIRERNQIYLTRVAGLDNLRRSILEKLFG